jgi:hypothetical protein
MWRKISLWVLSGLFVTGCSFTPSQLNANPALYGGKTVVVRGFVKLTPEVHVLYESRAHNDELHRESASGNPGFGLGKDEKYCVTIANPELLYKNRATVTAKKIVVQGKFIDTYQVGETVDLGACPLPTAIIIDNDALVRRYPSLVPQN